MKEDYYVDDIGLAMFFEIHWMDKIRELGNNAHLESSSRHVNDDFIVTKHFREIADCINTSLTQNDIKPHGLLEVGSALGRTSYEMIVGNKSLEKVTMVEPSKSFIDTCRDLLIEGKEVDFTYIKSRKEVASFKFDASLIAQDCQNIEFDLINQEFDDNTVSDQYDLVICLNVLDQCPSPTTIVDALKNRVKPGGVLCLSCTYQWNKKHLLDFSETVDDINVYFSKNQWKRLSQHEHEYKFRFAERYAHVFYSHLVVYQKQENQI